jgi:ankyrin repeat protein
MLLCAAVAGSVQVFQYLVEARCDVNARNKKQETALLRAAELGHLESVTWLLRHGALVDEADKFGNTPLMGCLY